MENLIFSLNVTLPIFLTIVIGYVLKQIHMLNDSFVTVANKFNFKVTLPALLFLDLYQADFFSVWDTGYVLYCFFATLICFTVIMTGASLFLKDKDIIGEFVQGSYRGSAAVLGLAFIQNIYGKATIAPLMIIGSVPLYNILAVLILSFTGPGEHKLDKKGLVKSLKGIATNPIILGILFGLLASVSQIKLPFLVTKTMSNLSVMATSNLLLQPPLSVSLCSVQSFCRSLPISPLQAKRWYPCSSCSVLRQHQAAISWQKIWDMRECFPLVLLC